MQGILFGTAIFDALGIGFETRSYDEVQSIIKSTPDVFNKYIAPWKNPYYDIALYKIGMFTDDTQLTLAVAKGLKNGLNLDAIAKAHIDEYNLSTNGWGSGTKQSVERLINRVSPLHSGNTNSFGNGVLIKIAPLAHYFYTMGEFEPILENVTFVSNLTRMTHNNEMSCLFANMHVYLLIQVYKDINFVKDPENFVVFLKTLFSGLCQMLNTSNSTRVEVLKSVNMIVRNSLKELDDLSLLNLSNNASFHQKDTLVLVWLILLQEGVSLKAVHRSLSLGGDTDSNASILGGILGFHQSKQYFQDNFPDLYNILDRFDEIVEFCKNL